MRFGLSDLAELPSLKEFEQLARAALGSDEGIAPIEPEPESQSEAESAFSADHPEAGDAPEIADTPETSSATETGEGASSADPENIPVPQASDSAEPGAQQSQDPADPGTEVNPGNATAESAS